MTETDWRKPNAELTWGCGWSGDSHWQADSLSLLGRMRTRELVIGMVKNR